MSNRIGPHHVLRSPEYIQAEMLLDQIPTVRRTLGITNEELAERIGVAISTLHKLQTRQAIPSAKVVRRFESAFGHLFQRNGMTRP